MINALKRQDTLICTNGRYQGNQNSRVAAHAGAGVNSYILLDMPLDLECDETEDRS